MKPAFAVLSLLAIQAQAQNAPELPASLFDIELGGVYLYSSDGAESGAAGTFPVRRLVSEPIRLHRGVSLYFEPLNERAEFPYAEYLLDDGNRITNFRIYVFPVLPENPRTMDDLRGRDLPQQVFMIEWSLGNRQGSDDRAYDWASDLCRSLAVDMEIEPEASSSVETGVYQCTFSNGERELHVSSAIGRTIQLSVADEISVAVEGAVYSTIRRLELQEIFERRRQEARR